MWLPDGVLFPAQECRAAIARTHMSRFISSVHGGIGCCKAFDGGERVSTHGSTLQALKAHPALLVTADRSFCRTYMPQRLVLCMTVNIIEIGACFQNLASSVKCAI